MKVLIALLATETNSFSPIPTGRAAFEETFLTRQATQMEPNPFSAPLIEWRRAAEARGWEVVESLAALAQPAGPTIRAVYEEFRDEILSDIERSRPDIVLFSLHGAMMAEGYDDCEGDLLTRARDILGASAVIGAELDPHHHLTTAMLDAANLLVAFKEYPHTDTAERARELFTLAADTALGKINPVMRDYDCRMVAFYQTPMEPMRSFVEQMQAREGLDGVLSLSLTHGFPWGDSERVGSRMLAIADGDAAKAESVAAEFGARLWDLREDLRIDWPDILQALDRIDIATAYPVVLADTADNAGGGAPSDSTFVLEEVLKRGLKDIALGLFWDPVLVRMCKDVGVGGTLQIRLGGKIGKMSGQPVDLMATVRSIRDDMTQEMGGSSMPMGTGVWLEADGVHLVINDLRSQTFHPSAFTDLGMDIGSMKALVVKSTQHFYAAFAPIASEVIHIASSGAITPDFAGIPYTKRHGRYWPKTENPFG